MALAFIEIDPNAVTTGTQVRDLLVAMTDADRKVVLTRPATGEKPVFAIQLTAGNKAKIEYDTVPV